jgi:ribosomal protein S27AE
MRTWLLARDQITCGHCGASILKDAPVQRISYPGVRRSVPRCAACAEGTFSPDVVPHTISQGPSSGWTSSRPLASARALAQDFKMRAAGEDDA